LAFNIAYKKSIGKDLKAIGKPEAKRILDKIEEELSARASACPLLKGQFVGMRKLRIGDYRVIFTLADNDVLVLRIGHRKEIYN